MNKKSVIKNISYSFSSNVLSLLLGILATLLFPKFLGVAGYGYYQLYPGFSEKHDEHRLKPHKMDIPRHNYLF